MSDLFECSICCDQVKNILRNRSQKVICPSCDMVCCTKCQYTYGKGDCMGCQMVFKMSYIKETMGTKFITNILKPKILEELLKEQEASLPNIQPLVEWEKQIRLQKKEARFGKISAPIERPKLSTMRLDSTFPCPKMSCRGFVENGICAICEQLVCKKCHEINDDGHLCKIENLMAFAMINRDTKPCPKCTTNIFKIEGCDHMFCTNCRTHFSWNTSKITGNSSNAHYLHLRQFSDNIATLDVAVNDNSNNCNNDEFQFSLYRDKVKLENVALLKFPDDIMRCLYEDSNVIRLTKRQRFNEQTILEEYSESLQELQIKYLLDEIDKTHWARQIYRITHKKTLSVLYATILNIYLSTIDQIQLQLTKNTQAVVDNVRMQLVQLIELCNESFDSIREEHGGSKLHIRNIDDSYDVAIFTT